MIRQVERLAARLVLGTNSEAAGATTPVSVM